MAEGPKFNRCEEGEEILFECHVAGTEKVENIKCNASTSSYLHKEASGTVSLRVRMEFHVPTHTQDNANLGRRNQFSPMQLPKINSHYFSL